MFAPLLFFPSPFFSNRIQFLRLRSVASIFFSMLGSNEMWFWITFPPHFSICSWRLSIFCWLMLGTTWSLASSWQDIIDRCTRFWNCPISCCITLLAWLVATWHRCTHCWVKALLLEWLCLLLMHSAMHRYVSRCKDLIIFLSRRSSIASHAAWSLFWSASDMLVFVRGERGEGRGEGRQKIDWRTRNPRYQQIELWFVLGLLGVKKYFVELLLGAV